MNEKVQLLISGNQVCGLTRSALLNKVWHKNSPEAARHLSGFGPRKNTVYKLYALFDVLPPSEMPTETTMVSIFEQCLMGLIRIHRIMTIPSIVMTWGRDNGHTEHIINNAVKSIGLAGRDLSILDITPEYLETTCPQKYKDEGPEK